MKIISNEADYKTVMAKIDSLMARGSQQMSAQELIELRGLAERAQSFEQNKYVIDAPETLIGMIEMKRFERKLRQNDLAKLLQISEAKLSLIMNGKQKPGVDFLKAVHSKLDIDASFILEHA